MNARRRTASAARPKGADSLGQSGSTDGSADTRKGGDEQVLLGAVVWRDGAQDPKEWGQQ